jgi:hypothetical protein
VSFASQEDDHERRKEDVGKRRKDDKIHTGLRLHAESRTSRGGYAVMAIDANGDTSNNGKGTPSWTRR